VSWTLRIVFAVMIFSTIGCIFLTGYHCGYMDHAFRDYRPSKP